MDYEYQQPQPYEPSGFPMFESTESKVNNIVAQIDPKTIIDNLDHALKGEQWNKEEARWVKSGDPLVNNECRNYIINYLTAILTNNTTLANLDEKRLSLFMEGVIDSIRRNFVTNLEKFGFVPPGIEFKKEIYYNKGSPDSARMTLVSDMVYKTCFLVFSRALKGSESTKIFRSLQMRDTMGYGIQPNFEQQKSGWLGKLFGRR